MQASRTERTKRRPSAECERTHVSPFTANLAMYHGIAPFGDFRDCGATAAHISRTPRVPKTMRERKRKRGKAGEGNTVRRVIMFRACQGRTILRSRAVSRARAPDGAARHFFRIHALSPTGERGEVSERFRATFYAPGDRALPRVGYCPTSHLNI